MIHGSSIIHVLNLDRRESYLGTVEEVLNKLKASLLILGENDYDFSKNNVMIGDWTGWTKLNAININMCDRWIELNPLSVFEAELPHFNIQLSGDTPIPLYDPFNKSSEFHGEVKYNYKIKQLKDVIGDEDCLYMRNKEIHKYRESNNQFIQMISTETNLKVSIGYEIYTRSGFVNVNNFHLLSSEAKNEELVQRWK